PDRLDARRLPPQGGPADGRGVLRPSAADTRRALHRPARPGPPQRLHARLPAADPARTPPGPGRRRPGRPAARTLVRAGLAGRPDPEHLRPGHADPLRGAPRARVPPVA